MEITLTGIDGSNPLGFLAALGAQRLLDAEASAEVRLRWSLAGTWRPTLEVPDRLLPASEDEALARRAPAERALVAALAAAVAARRQDSILDLRWPDPDGKDRELRHLRSPPEEWRRWALALRDGDRLTADFVAASAAEAKRDDEGRLKPTVFDFTTGQQMFLATAEALLHCVTAADLDEALFGPWLRQRPLKVFSWDATDTRDYALRASDPSKGKTGVPGADALALWGLTLLPVVPTADENRTTAAGGKWKSGSFRWALWTGALTVDVVRTVLALGGRADLAAAERAGRRIGVRFEAGIGRSDRGYGSFSPPEVLG